MCDTVKNGKKRKDVPMCCTLSKLCKIKGTTTFSELCFKSTSMVEKYTVCPQNQVAR